jgi:orotate phosphoribosyltransferase
MYFRSFASLNKDIFAWLQWLPKDIDLIVGIPRSGMLVANILSLYMNKSMTDVEGLIEGRIITSGKRLKTNTEEVLSFAKKILVVDDSVMSGEQIRRIKTKIAEANLDFEIVYGAVYVKPGSENIVDYFYELIPPGRVFEWNVFHSESLSTFCFDIDGVLCRDPTEQENDDGPLYRHFIQNVEPVIVPGYTIGWLVTCRLEKYRKLTEEWLARHGIKYNNLVMMDFPDKAARIKSGSYGKFKADVYKKSEAKLFIESSQGLAEEITKLTGKPVLCTGCSRMNNPTFFPRNYYRIRRFLKMLRKNPLEALSLLRKRLFIKIAKPYLIKNKP